MFLIETVFRDELYGSQNILILLDRTMQHSANEQEI